MSIGVFPPNQKLRIQSMETLKKISLALSNFSLGGQSVVESKCNVFQSHSSCQQLKLVSYLRFCCFDERLFCFDPHIRVGDGY